MKIKLFFFIVFKICYFIYYEAHLKTTYMQAFKIHPPVASD